MDGNFVIVGAGGLGREVQLYLDDVLHGSGSANFKGFLDDNPQNISLEKVRSLWLGTIADYSIQNSDRFLVAVGEPRTRRAIVQSLSARGARFGTLIHPTSYLAAGSAIGPGSILAPFCFVGPGAAIGAHVVFNTYASCGHDSVVGDYSVFSPYAVVNGNVHVEEGVFLGTHATVVLGKSVGRDSKIGAGCTALRDIPARSLALGNPAQAREVYSEPEA